MPANFQEKTARTWALFCFNFAPKFCDNLLAENLTKLQLAVLPFAVFLVLPNSETRLIRLTFWDTLWEQFGLSDQSALIDASLWRKPLKNLCKSSSTQPFTQPSKPLWERNGLNISRFKLFRSISYQFTVVRIDNSFSLPQKESGKRSLAKKVTEAQRAPKPRPNLHSPVWVGSSGGRPQRGRTNLGVFCSYMAGHYPGILMTGHIGTNTPKFVRPRRGRPPLDPTQTGLCKFGWVWSSLRSIRKSDQKSPKMKKSDRTPFADLLFRHPDPKDPAVLKILRRSKFTMRSKFTTA